MPSIYVCLLSVYVCWGKIVLQRTRSDSLRKLSVFDVLNNFFKICEGGYFWTPQKTAPMYVCQVCMFAMHVCMFAKLVCMFAKLVCMCVCQCTYVWEKSCSRGRSSIRGGGTADDPDIQNPSACEACSKLLFL